MVENSLLIFLIFQYFRGLINQAYALKILHNRVLVDIYNLFEFELGVLAVKQWLFRSAHKFLDEM